MATCNCQDESSIAEHSHYNYVYIRYAADMCACVHAHVRVCVRMAPLHR